MVILFDFMCICPITFELLNIGHHVLKGLYLPYTSFYIDVSLKLNLKLGTLM